jgi:hypothetical protein
MAGAIVGLVVGGLHFFIFARRSFKNEPLGKAKIYQYGNGAKTHIDFLTVSDKSFYTKVENVKLFVNTRVNAVLVSVGGNKRYYNIDGYPNAEVILPNEEMKKKWTKLLQQKIQPRQDIVPKQAIVRTPKQDIVPTVEKE